jgi:hypothetical protein
MKSKLSILAIAILFVISSCQKEELVRDFHEAADKSSQSELKASHGKGKQAVLNFRAHLSGDQEVAAVPVVTNATGQAIFQLSKDGTELSYKLIVANIENVRMAHIHVGAAGVNGPVVAWLYPSGPPAVKIPGKTNGILAEGVITSSSLVGDLKEQPLSALLELMKAEETYVNVHTDQYPPGEIRGQIKGNVK